MRMHTGEITVLAGNLTDTEWIFASRSYIEWAARANDVEIRDCSHNIYNSFYLSLLMGYYIFGALL